MPKKFLVLFFVILLSLQTLALIVPSVVEGYYTNMPASVVIGQPDFTSNSANQGGGTTASVNTLSTPRNVVKIGQKLVIPDFSNNRVLIYNQVPTYNNTPADVVIGQSDFTSSSANQGGTVNQNTLNTPEFVATDGTKLFISDYSNHRVLIYNNLPTTNNASADLVIGQVDFTHNSGNQGGGTPTASTLKNPVGIYTDGTKLLIVDSSNHRILIYNSIPTSNNASADLVLGQADFTHGSANRGLGTPNAGTLSTPFGVNIGAGKLFVGDQVNNRVLIWNSMPTTNGQSADVVIGQTSFSGFLNNQGGSPAANTFKSSQGVEYVNGRLFVVDTLNFRMLVFNSVPTVNNASADLVLGQANFAGGSSNGVNATSFQANFSTVIDNKLFIADSANNRVLIYPNIIDTPQLNINLPFEKIDDTHLRVRGNIQLGDRTSTYAMQWVKAEVNGQGLGYVTSLGGGRDNGDNLTLYDFFHEFSPGNVVNTDMNNYTLKLVASSFNADTTSLFYFQPFNFKSLTRIKNNLAFDFSVNKYQIQKVKDNVDHFEIQSSTDSGKFWKKLSTNIITDKIDVNTGQVYTTIPNSLLPGIKYSVRLIAVSRDSNWQQPSNILNYFVPKKKVAAR